MRKIKLIWDFRGVDAQKTAEHHLIHLEEFCTREALDSNCGVESLAELHFIAYLVVEEQKMIPVRDALRPHRGELAD